MAKLDTSEPITAQQLESIVERLQNIQVDGKEVFQTVFAVRSSFSDGQVCVYAETWLSSGCMAFFMTDEEIHKLTISIEPE